MKLTISIVIFLLLNVYWCVQCKHNRTDYDKHKLRLVKAERKLMLGSQIHLTENDRKLNQHIVKLKKQFLNETSDLIKTNTHYFNLKDYFINTELYRILRQMPKGAVLHIHDTGLLGFNYLKQITYKFADLFICIINPKSIRFQHSKEAPKGNCSTSWTLVDDARKKDKIFFDYLLQENLSMFVDDPQNHYPTRSHAITKQLQVYNTIVSLISFKDVYEQFIQDGLQALYDDGVIYAEIRLTLRKLVDINGEELKLSKLTEIINKAIRVFKNENPQFLGVKIIYTPLTAVSLEELSTQLKYAKAMKKKLDENFAGFDQTWHNDPKAMSLDKEAAVLIGSSSFPYYFHAGDSAWNGDDFDNNLFSALALKSRRISPAFGLSKHWVLVKRVKRKKIAIEATVISDQVFRLVNDFRNHPLAYFLAKNMPVSVSSDFPGYWDSKPATDDLFVTWVLIASEESNLKLIKGLALNSIRHSSMDRKMKISALTTFKKQWSDFVEGVFSIKMKAKS